MQNLALERDLLLWSITTAICLCCHTHVKVGLTYYNFPLAWPKNWNILTVLPLNITKILYLKSAAAMTVEMDFQTNNGQ